MVVAHFGRAGLGRREILISHQADRLCTGLTRRGLARAVSAPGLRVRAGDTTPALLSFNKTFNGIAAFICLCNIFNLAL